MKNPYDEIQIDKNTFIRTFSPDLDVSEMIWHRDPENRIVECIGETNWKVQFDNQLPIGFEGQIFIPKGVFHRLIKGDGELKIKLRKLPD